MRISTKLKILYAIGKNKIFKKRIPLFVSWIITRKCNLACKYCSTGTVTDSQDLSTAQVSFIIDRLAEMGTKIISFTGGEPFLRQDINEIIDYCSSKGIFSSINSNGSILSGKIKDIRGLGALILSLDGPEEVHDLVRGKGSFKAVINSAIEAQSRGIKLKFLTVLSALNLHAKNIDFLLQKAREFKTTVTFQPAGTNLLRAKGLNPIAPLEKEYRSAIAYIILKKKNNKLIIGNSIAGLKHISCWPNHKRIKCAGEMFYCRIDNDGNIAICGSAREEGGNLNCLDKDFKVLFSRKKKIDCNSCWCAGRVEVNHVFAWNMDAALNILRCIP